MTMRVVELFSGIGAQRMGHPPTPFAMLDDSEGFAFDCWCDSCLCCRHVYAESLEELKEAWNKGAVT